MFHLTTVVFAMKKIGVIGIGNMGSGLAKNLIKAGFDVYGYDLLPHRLQAFKELGGVPMISSAEVGTKCDAVFVMVMTGDEAKEVILGEGLLSTLKPGSVILLTATINASEAREIEQGLSGSELKLIDSPVSGGYPGAQSGTLTLMASGPQETLDQCANIMQAVSGTIHHVGTEIGMGQTVKACLQSLIGSIFSATFEASVLAAKAGVDAAVLEQVFNTSSAGSVITKTSLENIIARQFENTGSHISTMYKDLTISMDLARELGVPLFTAATAMQLFQAGITKYPDSDNWSVTKITEEIVGAKLKRQ